MSSILDKGGMLLCPVVGDTGGPLPCPVVDRKVRSEFHGCVCTEDYSIEQQPTELVSSAG